MRSGRAEQIRMATPPVARPCLPAAGAVPLDALPLAGAILADGGARPIVVARNPACLLPDAALDEGGAIARAVMALLAEPAGAPSRSFRWRDGDGVAARHFEVHLARIDAAIAAPACFLSLIDRTAEVESARSLRAELNHDSLTGLPNRAAFAEMIDAIVAGGGRHAVLLVDLARFGRINSSLGGMTGDEVIITVARRLLGTVRAGDRVARVGGDEFGMLVRLGDRQEEAMEAARRIRRTLAAPFRLGKFEVGLECAIGFALSSEAVDGEEIVRNAQLALKRAKASGRIEVHHPGEGASARYRLDIESELRRAIEQNELTLAFQPIVDLASDRTTGFEALARWHHPVRGPIEPGEFIPVAEEAGLIVPLGRWALDTALATLAAWERAAGGALPVSMSVNVSAIQLARDDVPGTIAGLLARYRLAGERLTVELTESAIVQDPERTGRALAALKALDVRIAMDDFGTGYSNLSYLRRLPIDILKIDRSFVTGMLADRDKVAIVRAILSLADALGKTTTAEGIETIELGHTLAALGCTRGQGYHFARPLPADAALAYLQK